MAPGGSGRWISRHMEMFVEMMRRTLKEIYRKKLDEKT
jgi:hypothetical protein